MSEQINNTNNIEQKIERKWFWSGGRTSGASVMARCCRWSRPAWRERKHAKRSAFFVGITTLYERTIWFGNTTRSAREISVWFENRFGFGKIKAQKIKCQLCSWT
ncbi:hypothetical protein KKC56_03175 [Patescibacteria group bacterium]|nr:hypothetical protein [Patescibacteria group bacterium]